MYGCARLRALGNPICSDLLQKFGSVGLLHLLVLHKPEKHNAYSRKNQGKRKGGAQQGRGELNASPADALGPSGLHGPSLRVGQLRAQRRSAPIQKSSSFPSSSSSNTSCSFARNIARMQCCKIGSQPPIGGALAQGLPYRVGDRGLRLATSYCAAFSVVRLYCSLFERRRELW